MAFSSRVGSALALALLFATASRPGDRLVNLQHRVWQVDPLRKIEPFSYQFPVAMHANVFGSTEPLPSPDSRWVVFSREHAHVGYTAPGEDLHLLGVSSGQERQITRFGRPQGKRYASVEVVVTAWSADSRQILFAVIPGETTGPAEEWGEDLLVRKAPYGFYTYDVAKGTSHRLRLPKEFRFGAWLPDGSFLGTDSETKPCEQRLLLFREGEAHGTAVGAPSGSPSQLQVSDDGKMVIGYFGGGCEQPETAAITKINLETKVATQVVTMSPWAENQSPAFSPDGNHISYTHRTGMVAGILHESLIVDGRPLYSCQGGINYRWIDERSIAAACQNEVLVLDVTASPKPVQTASSASPSVISIRWPLPNRIARRRLFRICYRVSDRVPADEAIMPGPLKSDGIGFFLHRR